MLWQEIRYHPQDKQETFAITPGRTIGLLQDKQG